MIYEFEGTDGSHYEEFFSMADAPRIGEKIRRKGKTYTRIPSGGTQQWALDDVDLASNTLPLNWSVPDPDKPGERIKLAPRYDSENRPVFRSQNEIRQAVKKAQALGEPVVYDRGFIHY